jgi:hypothetical protein
MPDRVLGIFGGLFQEASNAFDEPADDIGVEEAGGISRSP